MKSKFPPAKGGGRKYINQRETSHRLMKEKKFFMKKDTGLQELQEGYKSYTTTTLIVPVKKSECPRKRKNPFKKVQEILSPQEIVPAECLSS